MKNLIAAFCMVCQILLFGQVDQNQFIAFNGKVINEESGAPVPAKVTFETMPEGNDLGFITANDQGVFNFYMREQQKYSVRVNAEGYFSYVEIFDASADSDNGVINLEIKLKAGGVGHVIRLERLIFGQGSAEITAESYEELNKLVVMMNDNPAMEIQLEGHTDFRGSAAANIRLSEMRVSAVKSYLVQKNIGGERVMTKAFGGTQPLSRESTPEASAQNRRVEVRILKVE